MDEFLVEFQPLGKRGTGNNRLTLLEIAQSTGVGLTAICGGTGACEECQVRLISGSLSPSTETEKNALGTNKLEEGWRLACQAYALSDVKLYIPPESLTITQRLQTEGQDTEVEVDPIIKIPGAYGLAVDIGTTKLAAYLVDLNTGKVVTRAGAMNPQVSYGEDVVNRIAYAQREPKGARILQRILIETINDLISKICKEGEIGTDTILDAVFVGNTAMHHLIAGIPVKQLGYSPYLPATSSSLSMSAALLGLNISSKAQVYLPPVIAGYVGADHLAFLMAIGVDKYLTLPGFKKAKVKSRMVAIDIGTNTEISLITSEKISCCSCASGPAFEGAHIKEGMRAAPGALDRARWKNGKLLWSTIDSQPPIGICGSGILDSIAALLEGGLINSNGRLSTGFNYIIVPVNETGLGRDLLLERNDINEIQLAKSAIRTAIEILLAKNGLSKDDIDELIVAGAFGTYLDTHSAIRVGMFPSLPSKIIHQVGNAAGVGARQMLVSVSKRHAAEVLTKSIDYVELATDKGFSELFIQNLKF